MIDQNVVDLDFKLVRFCRSLVNRPTAEDQVAYNATYAMIKHGLGFKMVTITLARNGVIGTPNRNLWDQFNAQVMPRSNRRVPGVQPIRSCQ